MEYIIIWVLVLASWTNVFGTITYVDLELSSHLTYMGCEAQKAVELERMPRFKYECVEQLAMRRK